GGPRVFQRRFGAFRKALRVQLRAGRQVEVDLRDRRDPAFVVLGGGTVAFPADFVFGFHRGAGAEDVAGLRPVAASRLGDRDGLGRELGDRGGWFRRRREGR